MAAIFVILSNGWHPRWLTMAYVIETCAKYPLQQNWKKKNFRVSEVRFNLPRFNPRLKHLCVTFMHFKKVTKKISQNRLKISCVKSSENRLGNSSSHQLKSNLILETRTKWLKHFISWVFIVNFMWDYKLKVTDPGVQIGKSPPFRIWWYVDPIYGPQPWFNRDTLNNIR